MGMTDQQALDLMMNDTFQEKEEATAKLQRAQLSSCQLPTYFAGWKGWLEAREQYKQRQGSAYTLRISTTPRSKKARSRCRSWSSYCNSSFARASLRTFELQLIV